MEQGFNLLLIGPHGTGKTESVIQAAAAADKKLKIFNCATLDPYTDLIGVPVPVKDEHGEDELKMVRPRSLQEAEVLFFDEINRAPQATQNAVFEIIQFGTVNGERLESLICCWAAMNPPDDEQYLVEEIDPALIDRFDAYHAFKPKVSVQYMSQFIDKNIAQALAAWWTDHNRAKRGVESYISPRRLMKIGLLYQKMGNIRAVVQAMPPGGKYDTNKLKLLLEHAKDGKPLPATDSLNSAGNNEIEYTKKGILEQKDAVVSYLKANQKDLETQNKIANALSTGVGAKRLLTEYAPVLDNLKVSVLEALFGGFSSSKRYQIYNAKHDIGESKLQQNYGRLYRAIRYVY